MFRKYWEVKKASELSMPSLLDSPAFQAAGYLQSGDHLTRSEFLRIWRGIPNLKRAELIRGVVYLMASPLSVEHADTENNLSIWAGTYRIATPGCASGNNATNLLLGDCPQPDVNLRIIPEYGGKSRVRKKLLFGPAELLMEVCMSSASMDLHDKFNLYEEAGVSEYLAVIVNKKEIRWFRLTHGKFQPMHADREGVYRSRVFPGLWLDSHAFFKNDMTKVMATLQKGIASDEHQRFTEELAARKRAAKK
jgi:Uma2 family endonuclease